jgi:ABC-type transport system involved in multi-copper enzyme maturation permease subunit
MFAALTLEREPLLFTWDSFPGYLNSWVQIVGGFAMLALVLWLIAYVASRGSPEGGNAIVRLLAGSFIGLLATVLLGPFGVLIVFLWLLRRQARGADVSMATVNLNAPGARRSALMTALFVGAVVWAGFGYLLLLALYLPEIIHSIRFETPPDPLHADNWRAIMQRVLWTVAGGSALFAVILPILADLSRLSPRRIWAIARLSFKEALRRKVLWVFLALLLVVLFGSWFIKDKPENQVRTYVQVVFLAMGLVMLFLAALISGFGIPDDIRHQTIHTVLTKPVHRFEIFLGRFIGYTVLMTAALIVVSGLGLLYVLRNINQDAANESLKAREPLYGDLTFQGTKEKTKGTNVGREWEYRTYIIGKPRNAADATEYAIWSFDTVPAALRDQKQARLEFALDIYRTHKGVEGQGVFCTFFVESWRFDADNPVMMKRYNALRAALENGSPQGLEQDQVSRYNALKAELEKENAPNVVSLLADEFGFYEVSSMEVMDYHTQSIDVPRGVFNNANRPATEADKDRLEELRRRREWPAAPMRVRIRCDSSAQFVGMAQRDLYYRLDPEDSPGTGNRPRFAVNFFKGGFGLWLRLCLMIGLAVALSTYLSGVITLLTTAILYILGFFQDFITDVALKRNVGGGPLESMMRLVKRPGGEPTAGQLDATATTQVATSLDTVFSWSLRRVLDVIPDLANYTFTDYVAEGMAISAGQMAMSFLVLVGYLLPWAVLAYYLLKWREVASST